MRHKNINLALRINTKARIKSIIEEEALEKIRSKYESIPFEHGVIEDIIINKISDEFNLISTVDGLYFVYNIETTIKIAYFEIGDLFMNIKLSKLESGFANPIGLKTDIPLYIRTQQEVPSANIIVESYQPNENKGSYICSIATYPKFNNIIMNETSAIDLKFDMKPFYPQGENTKLSKNALLYLDPFGEEKNRIPIIQKSILPFTTFLNINEFKVKENATIADIKNFEKSSHNMFFISFEEVKKLKIEDLVIGDKYKILLIYSPIIGLFDNMCVIVIFKCKKAKQNYTQNCIDKFIFDVQEYINMKKLEASNIETLKPWSNPYLNSLYINASENIKKLFA